MQDCGHVAAFAGVCQYQGCAKRLCPDCLTSCEACGAVLCGGHQVWLDTGRRVFCKDDARRYLAKRLVLRLTGRDRHAG